jgi:hypothetical protein
MVAALLQNRRNSCSNPVLAAVTLVAGRALTRFLKKVRARPSKANFAAIVQSRAILTKRLSSRHENRASKNVRESGTSQAEALI